MFKILIVHVYWKFEELLQVFGRHVASNRMVSGAYKTEYGDGDDISKVIKRVEVRGCFIMAWETYCVCSVSYYVTPNAVGWRIAILRFFFLYYYYSYYYSSTHFCPLYFLEMPWSNFMKPCRNIICQVKLCWQGLINSKCLPLPWKWPKC